MLCGKGIQGIISAWGSRQALLSTVLARQHSAERHLQQVYMPFALLFAYFREAHVKDTIAEKFFAGCLYTAMSGLLMVVRC
jgi:hypothetical protein